MSAGPYFPPGVLDHPGFAAAFKRRHQADLDAIEASLMAEAYRLDAVDQLDAAAPDRLAAEYGRQAQALIDRFCTDFVASAINAALLLDRMGSE